MPSLLSRASRTAGRVSEYAVVPVALTLFAFGKVLAAADRSSVSFNVKFSFPADVATLWTVVDPPAQGIAVHSPTPLLFVPVFLVVEAAVVAGYLGGIRDAHWERDPDFVAAIGDYWLSILGIRAVQFLLFGGLAIALFAGGAGAAVLVGAPVLFVLGYLLWGAPYLVVLRDSDAVTALAESASLALDGGYFRFSVAYAFAVSVVSVVVSPLVTSAGVVGIFVGAVLVAYPSLVGSAAATIVVDDAAAAASRDA
jgi:hypothetical protein